MDEERFQEIVSLKYDLLFDWEDREGWKRRLTENGISEEEATQYIERFVRAGPDFLTNFGPEKLSDALLTLDLYTSNINLKRIRDRMQRKVDANVHNVLILLPNGNRSVFTIYWKRGLALVPDAEEDDERVAARKLVGMSVDDKNTLDLRPFRVETDVVTTLEMSDGTCHIVFPLADLWPKWKGPEMFDIVLPDGSNGKVMFTEPIDEYGRPLVQFSAVYVLDTREVWALAPHSHYEEGEEIKPRIERFPGTEEFISVGVLSDFFTDNISLQIKDRGYFYIRETIRFKGKIHAIRNKEATDVAQV